MALISTLQAFVPDSGKKITIQLDHLQICFKFLHFSNNFDLLPNVM